MERHRGDRSSGNHDGGRGGRHHHSRMSSRSSSGNHDYPNQRQPFSRGGGGGGGGGPSGAHRYPTNNFPMHHSSGGGGGGRSGGGGGGNMRQGSGYGGSPQSSYLSGHKRPSSGFSSPGGGFSRRGSSPDSADTGTFAKLFVGSVPRTAREEEIRPLFEEHGNVLEVALIKDKRTGQQQGCCFVKYATSEEADRAIRALHNQCTLPGGLGPIQVRYADGERERLAEYKLFVGSLNKQATEKEIEEIFSPYGRVEDVYIMRDDLKQSRGCGFVKFSYREMAAAAIDALSGKYVMRGCDQPLTVRFADPKRPKTGDSRAGPTFGGPGFGQRSQLPPVNRSGYDYPMPTPNAGGNLGMRMPPNSWHPMSPENFGMHSSQVNNVIGGHPGARGGAGAPAPAAAGTVGLGVFGAGGPPNGSLLGPAVAPIPSSQQGLNMPLMQGQPFGQPLSPSKKSLPSPQHLPSSLQYQQHTSSYAQGQTALTSVQFSQQLQTPLLMNQQAFGQRPPSHHVFSLNHQLSSSQPQIQQLTPALQQIPSSSQLQSGPVSVPHAQLGVVANQTPQLQVQPSPGHQQQLMLQQQPQASQLSFQSPQHAYSQLQQQLHLVQSTSQGQPQPIAQPHKQQTSWSDVVPQTVVSTPVTTAVIASTATAPAISVSTKTEAPVTCNWTEHTSPEGYKYYYNSVTRESRWEKPEELIAFEQKQQQQPQQQQQQMAPSQHLQAQAQAQAQLQSQLQSPQQVSQTQQPQPQVQGQQQLQMQLQQPALSTLYQTPGVLGSQNIQGLSYMQLQGSGSTIDPSRLQQAVAAQEWMWKNKPTGN